MNTHSKTMIVLAALAGAWLVATPTAVGQDWQGQDSEFGSIRAAYTVTMEGARVPVEARIVLREMYPEQESRFFMFAFTVENTPMDVRFEHLVRMDNGNELVCYQREGDSTSAIKCFVDLRDMPPAGTEIRASASVGSQRTGMFQLGAIVVPFTYTWNRVQMSNGLNAELYAGTQMNVAHATSDGGFGGSGNGALAKVPGVGLVGVAAAGAVAVALLEVRRKRSAP